MLDISDCCFGENLAGDCFANFGISASRFSSRSSFHQPKPESVPAVRALAVEDQNHNPEGYCAAGMSPTILTDFDDITSCPSVGISEPFDNYIPLRQWSCDLVVVDDYAAAIIMVSSVFLCF